MSGTPSRQDMAVTPVRGRRVDCHTQEYFARAGMSWLICGERTVVCGRDLANDLRLLPRSAKFRERGLGDLHRGALAPQVGSAELTGLENSCYGVPQGRRTLFEPQMIEHQSR